jgi:transposase
LLTDEEWSFFEPFVVSARPLGGRPARDHRRVVDAIFWIARTGAPWRDLPAELGNWNSVFRQFRRWTVSAAMRPGFRRGRWMCWVVLKQGASGRHYGRH